MWALMLYEWTKVVTLIHNREWCILDEQFDINNIIMTAVVMMPYGKYSMCNFHASMCYICYLLLPWLVQLHHNVFRNYLTYLFAPL